MKSVNLEISKKQHFYVLLGCILVLLFDIDPMSIPVDLLITSESIIFCTVGK